MATGQGSMRSGGKGGRPSASVVATARHASLLSTTVRIRVVSQCSLSCSSPARTTHRCGGTSMYVRAWPCRPAAPRVHGGRATRRVSTIKCQHPRHHIHLGQTRASALAPPRPKAASWSMRTALVVQRFSPPTHWQWRDAACHDGGLWLTLALHGRAAFVLLSNDKKGGGVGHASVPGRARRSRATGRGCGAQKPLRLATVQQVARLGCRQGRAGLQPVARLQFKPSTALRTLFRRLYNSQASRTAQRAHPHAQRVAHPLRCVWVSDHRR